MAKKRKSTKRRNRSLSSGGTKRRTHRRRASSKGLLSDGGIGSDKSPVTWPQAFKRTIGSMAGGGLAIAGNKLADAAKANKIIKLVGTAVIVLIGAKFGMPATAGGFGGGMTALMFQNGLLAEDANYANQNALNEMPIYLSANGEPMVLEEGENGQSGYRILSDDEVASLAEQGVFDEYELVD